MLPMRFIDATYIRNRETDSLRFSSIETLLFYMCNVIFLAPCDTLE